MDPSQEQQQDQLEEPEVIKPSNTSNNIIARNKKIAIITLILIGLAGMFVSIGFIISRDRNNGIAETTSSSTNSNTLLRGSSETVTAKGITNSTGNNVSKNITQGDKNESESTDNSNKTADKEEVTSTVRCPNNGGEFIVANITDDSVKKEVSDEESHIMVNNSTTVNDNKNKNTKYDTKDKKETETVYTENSGTKNNKKDDTRTNTTKEKWPGLIGMDGNEAKKIIESDRPDLSQVEIVPNNAMVTMDYRTDRVRIYVNENNVVTRIPVIG